VIPATIDAAYVVERLEEAGRTLMALPSNAPRLGQRVQTYGYNAPVLKGELPDARKRLPRPDAAAISRMDEAYGWLAWIGNASVRRVVSMRSLIGPETGKAVHSWAKVGRAVGASYRAVQGWHAKGLETIAGALASS
jgi:hypothetical protein